MEVQSLGYVCVAGSNHDEWSSFATKLLGLQAGDHGKDFAAFRLDQRRQRLMVDAQLPAGRHGFGWEVADAAALDALAARLSNAGVEVRAEPPALADRRGVAQLVSFADPMGNRLEAFHGAHAAGTPFTPGRPLSGFRTGSLGLGHAVLTVREIAPALAFYQKVLGFRVSDYMLAPFKAYFLHTNPRHHSLALIETGTDGVHHLMMELLSLDDVGQGYDLALGEPERIGVTLGRHSNDFMTSFYVRSPSGFMIEYGWGGRDIDVDTWQASEFFHGASLWGHERYWLPPEQRAHALKMRLQAAADGFRAPVQVLDGHFETMRSR